MTRRWLGLLFLVACGGSDDSGATVPVDGGISGKDGSSTANGSSGKDGAADPSVGGASDASSAEAGSTNGYASDFRADPVAFDCADAPATILAKNPAHVTVGTSTVIVGYEQVGGSDQDPIVARFDDGKKVFCEHSEKGGGVDGRAYGVTWDGGANLYVVYTIVGGGTQFDTAAKGGWQSAYGDGGASAKVSVLGALDAATGVVTRATFVSAKVVKNGQLKTNTLVPAGAPRVVSDGSIELTGKPAYCTLNPDRSLMCDPEKSSEYPKEYRARFSPDLKTMTCASATGVSIVKQPCP